MTLEEEKIPEQLEEMECVQSVNSEEHIQVIKNLWRNRLKIKNKKKEGEAAEYLQTYDQKSRVSQEHFQTTQRSWG